MGSMLLYQLPWVSIVKANAFELDFARVSDTKYLFTIIFFNNLYITNFQYNYCFHVKQTRGYIILQLFLSYPKRINRRQKINKRLDVYAKMEFLR